MQSITDRSPSIFLGGLIGLACPPRNRRLCLRLIQVADLQVIIMYFENLCDDRVNFLQARCTFKIRVAYVSSKNGELLLFEHEDLHMT